MVASKQKSRARGAAHEQTWTAVIALAPQGRWSNVGRRYGK
jgi:hypothetical protein